MAIRKVSKVTYITDTGRELEVTEMTASHLMNAIAHHEKQIDAIAPYTQTSEFIRKRVDHLNDTILQLAAELSNRDPATDDEWERTHED